MVTKRNSVYTQRKEFLNFDKLWGEHFVSSDLFINSKLEEAWLSDWLNHIILSRKIGYIMYLKGEIIWTPIFKKDLTQLMTQ